MILSMFEPFGYYGVGDSFLSRSLHFYSDIVITIFTCKNDRRLNFSSIIEPLCWQYIMCKSAEEISTNNFRNTEEYMELNQKSDYLIKIYTIRPSYIFNNQSPYAFVDFKSEDQAKKVCTFKKRRIGIW